MPDATSERELLRMDPTVLAAPVLFFLSGMTALSYEVIWFKQFSHVWGASTLAMASVVGAFLIALGLGAWLFGARAHQLRRPLAWYGACEIGIGLLALLIPEETSLLWRLSTPYYAALRNDQIVYSVVRCATTLVLLGPPCVLMGGTLPLLVRHCSVGDRLSIATARLYGANSLGAALGCYLVGFHVLPAIGVFWTNTVTATVNIAVGVASFVLVIRSQTSHPASIETSDAAIPPAALPVAVLRGARESTPYVCLQATLTGCAALILQTVWTRQLALVLGSSTYAFSAMLFTMLAGMGIGSLLFALRPPRPSADTSLTVVHVLCVIITTSAIGMLFVPLAAACAGLSMPFRAGFVSNALLCIAGSALIELVPAAAMGMLIPALVGLIPDDRRKGPRTTGAVFAWIAIGNLLGTWAAALWVIPTWGTGAATGAALLLYVAAIALLASPRRIRFKTSFALAAAGVSLVGLWVVPDDPLRTNMGMYLYGYRDPASTRLLYFKEGMTANVLVSCREEHTTFRVNGKMDGGDGTDMAMQLGLAYVPRFLNPHAKNVLVIGFGTGSTSGASLLFPGTRVTCCELEPAVVAAAPYFRSVNHAPYAVPNRFRVVYDDGRAFVQFTSEQFDLILSEPSNPWVAGVANLFTTEFYESARRRLTAGGLLAQWVQTYSFTPADYAMIVRTMGDVFPHQALVRISDGDTILLASDRPLTRDAAVIEAAQRLVNGSPPLRQDLARYFGTSDVAALLMSRILMDERGLARLVGADSSSDRNRDDNLQLEFRAARRAYEQHTRTIGGWILGSADRTWIIEHCRRLGCEERHASTLHGMAMMFAESGQEELAGAVVEFGLTKAPECAELLADALLLSRSVDEARLDRLLTSGEQSAAEANRLGAFFCQQGRFDQAVTVFSRMGRQWPTSASVWTNLAVSLEAIGRKREAQEAIRQAISLDPANDLSLESAARLLDRRDFANRIASPAAQSGTP